MSTISLKNHLNFADNTRSNKINPNTTLCPLLIDSILSSNDIKVVEINFKAADKINVILQINPDTQQDVVALFQSALLSYNEAVRDKTIQTTYQSLLTNPLIINEQIDVSQAQIDGLHYVKYNKGGIKNDKFDAEIQFKKVLQFESKPKSTTESTSSSTPSTKSTTTSTTTTAPASTTKSVITTAKQSQHQHHANMISNHVMTSLFDRKDTIDFTTLSNVYKLNQERTTLMHKLEFAKNKDKEVIQTRLNEINTQLITLQPIYDTFQQSITNAVAQDVVTISNVGYTKGLTSAKKL